MPPPHLSLGLLSSPWSLLFGGLIWASVSDIKWRRVPNSLNFSLLLIGLFVQMYYHSWSGLWEGALGALTSFSVLLIPFALYVYRGGDVKLCIAIGAWIGVELVLWTIIYGVIIGGGLGVIILLWVRFKQPPALRAPLYLFMIDRSSSAEEAHEHSSPTVPMALAFSTSLLWVLYKA